MSDKAFIFDFNGTLFWDTEENKKAWSETALFFRKRGFSEEEFHYINGKSDKEAALLIAPDADDEQLKAIEVYKETLYKQYCYDGKRTLAKGAEKLLSELKERNIPIAIASSAPKMNMAWYIPYFKLDTYFDRKNIIAGRTDIKGKPEPDIFLLAAKNLKTPINNCVIIEDSKAGLIAARASGAKTVIGVKSTGADLSNTAELADFMIDDFKDARLWMLM